MEAVFLKVVQLGIKFLGIFHRVCSSRKKSVSAPCWSLMINSANHEGKLSTNLNKICGRFCITIKNPEELISIYIDRILEVAETAPSFQMHPAGGPAAIDLR